jgi:hypothetical protein
MSETITLPRATVKKALEALENSSPDQYPEDAGVFYDAKDALRAALEQTVQAEPVTNNPDPYHLSRILHELAGSASMCWEHVDRAGVFQSTQAADVVAAAIAEIRQRMKDAPPRREWRSLSEEEIEDLRDDRYFRFARAIEAALRSKNHD